MTQNLIARALLFVAFAGYIWLAHSIEQANKAACHGDALPHAKIAEETLAHRLKM